MPIVRLSAAATLARLHKGEPLLRGDYCAAYFPDDARPGPGVVSRLIRDDLLLDAPPNIGAPYAITDKGSALALAKRITPRMEEVLRYIAAGRPFNSGVHGRATMADSSPPTAPSCAPA
jgi:hypothetical protein